MINKIAHTGVDAIQSAKKQFVSTFVQNKDLERVLNGFVDAQADYTKSAIDAGIKACSGTVSVLSDREPYVKMAEQFSKFMPTMWPTK